MYKYNKNEKKIEKIQVYILVFYENKYIHLYII